MSVKVAVAGASGYAGGEVLRLLSAHPHVEVVAATGHSQAGARLIDVHPHLAALADLVLAPTSAQSLAGADAVVLALPHGQSGQLAAQLEPGTLVLDCGADHRLTSAAQWETFYGGEYFGAWTYGMPELLTGWTSDGAVPKQRANLTADTRRIAVPGCNVTAVTLALAPALAAGLAAAQDLVAVLANGVSGAGKSPKTHLLAAEILGSASPYAVGGTHRHIPEIEQNLICAMGAGGSNGIDGDPAGGPPGTQLGGAPGGLPVSISFTPTLVPMSRGILATCTARLAPGASDQAIRDAYKRAYDDERFIRVLPAGQWPATAAALGANTVLLGLAVDERAGRLVVVAAIDNLVKGTAGAAIQSLNLALGLPEPAGLTTEGLAP